MSEKNIRTKRLPSSQHSRWGRRLKTCHRHVFLTPRPLWKLPDCRGSNIIVPHNQILRLSVYTSFAAQDAAAFWHLFGATGIVPRNDFSTHWRALVSAKIFNHTCRGGPVCPPKKYKEKSSSCSPWLSFWESQAGRRHSTGPNRTRHNPRTVFG